MAEVSQCHVAGDWFDVCSCDIACPCIFGQPPTNNICRGVLAYGVREGHFGDVTLANLNSCWWSRSRATSGPGRPPVLRLVSLWIAALARSNKKRCR